MKWLAPPNDMKTLPPMLGRAETMNELVPMVSVGATDHQIEGEITPLFNVSGLSERQPDHSSAGLQSNKTERKKKKTTWKKIAQKYKNEKKVRHDTSKYEVITDIKELESSVAIYLQLEANRRCELRDSGELQRGDGGPDQGALTDRTPCLICASNTVHFYDEGNEICADCYPQECQHCGSLNLCSKHAFGEGHYDNCLDCGNDYFHYHLQTSQIRVENQLHNFSQQQSHLQNQFTIEEGCHGEHTPYVNSHLQIEEGCHGGEEPYVNSHLQIEEGCHGGDTQTPYVNVQVEKEMVEKEPIQ